MVFQSYALFPWKTVRGNVEFGLKMRGCRARGASRDAPQRFIDMVKLSGFEDHYPAELSGGMQQRVTLARILAADPGSAADGRAVRRARRDDPTGDAGGAAADP